MKSVNPNSTSEIRKTLNFWKHKFVMLKEDLKTEFLKAGSANPRKNSTLEFLKAENTNWKRISEVQIPKS